MTAHKYADLVLYIYSQTILHKTKIKNQFITRYQASTSHSSNLPIILY